MTTDIEIILRNARNQLNELGEAVENLATTYPDVFEDTGIGERLKSFRICHQEAVDRLRAPNLSIAMIGTTSSGKSTIVNALIGRKIAPIEAGEMSGGVLTLRHACERKLIIEETEGSAWETGVWSDLGDEALYEKIRDGVMRPYHDTREKRDCMAPRVTAYIPLLPASDENLLGLPQGVGVEFIDLPGLKSETPGLTNKLMTLPLNPILGGADLVTDLVGHNITINKLTKIQNKLSSVLNLTQIAAGASILNIGVSIAGFAYMGYKLHQIQNSIDNVQKSIEAGFNRINKRLDNLSGQLAYLHLLVEDSRQKQQRIGKAILELHRTILVKEVANLQAELIDRNRFPDSPVRNALKVASLARIVLSDQAMQAKPVLEAETRVN